MGIHGARNGEQDHVSGRERQTSTYRGRLYLALTAITTLAATPGLLSASRPKDVWIAVATVAALLLANLWIVDKLMAPIYALKRRLEIKNYGEDGARQLQQQEEEVDADSGFDVNTLVRALTPSTKDVDVKQSLPSEFNSIERLARAGRVSELAMESVKRDLFRHLSHQLKSPLAIIRSHVQTTKSALLVSDQATGNEALDEIDRMSFNMSSLVEQMLAMSYVVTLEESGLAGQAANISGAIMEVVKLRRKLAEQKAIEIRTDVEAGLWVRGNKILLQELVAALIDNSLRYSPEGTFIQVAANRVPGTKAMVLTVTDQGRGIPEKERERVFDPFYGSTGTDENGNTTYGSRVHRSLGSGHDKSHGLGLSLVKAIVNLHGATISLGDGPGKRGLMVRVLFPTIAAPVDD